MNMPLLRRFQILLPIFILFISFTISLSACRSERAVAGEILIEIEPSRLIELNRPDHPEPHNTGLPSLDALNQAWQVKQMIPLYPDLADDEIAGRYGLAGVYRLTVPANTDLKAMIAAYDGEPVIRYAELNQTARIND